MTVWRLFWTKSTAISSNSKPSQHFSLNPNSTFSQFTAHFRQFSTSFLVTKIPKKFRKKRKKRNPHVPNWFKLNQISIPISKTFFFVIPISDFLLKLKNSSPNNPIMYFPLTMPENSTSSWGSLVAGKLSDPSNDTLQFSKFIGMMMVRCGLGLLI